ncbi:ubiquitin-conjugating enzyme [Yamadazyma tenuis]|uniref:UBC core domain-containing protein n=1 Tax=Candida tenuis (strain ATCC 10573 / BCRC 21748 / CBS 615 / JCM 9827 / NBRC 10315 / NRRL Y-1498 / VKM Y-70) TaxID=590646 RepID=G3B4Y7_CANTC|nr:uncharacterized protein CANTEDRAFT_114054 [Yamadazyma tenuis ATCC 10573]XP_006686640.1 uncharacterized protein CANTEDRAFT_114054 [Yamadazyma tenuis ATCC 10573]EGV64325.1 hypothetical protein CANTEDRAFT_114054 [Yamadazyma tenuis ATCC 10573]EGV64326.1 hypothetical protein CANTEDRAFT_114054 [Yamadazyma tenuis ATCC 10573]WEJ96361.1 ubiquitin-conjugating enzyme [Yamadazyma tenuis]
MAEKRLFKELNQLSKVAPNYSNHQILSLAPKDVESSVYEWQSVICKPSKIDSKFYHNGQWTLNISVPQQYPIVPPKISFSGATPIFHPNINVDTGEICLDILKSESWTPAWNLEHLVVAILVLIDDPEPDSPLNIDSANLFRHDKAGFESFAQYTIWKHGTFYEGERARSGAKAGQQDDIISQDQELEIALQENSSKSINVIKDVGKQITQEFINKVDEITHSKQNSVDSIDHNVDYNNAKKYIAEKVNRQVLELCSKSVSPVNEIEGPEEPLDPIVEGEKLRFLQEVDSKVQSFSDAAKEASASEKVSTVSSTSSKDNETISAQSSHSNVDKLKKSMSIRSFRSDTSGGSSNKKKHKKRDKLKEFLKRTEEQKK